MTVIYCFLRGNVMFREIMWPFPSLPLRGEKVWIEAGPGWKPSRRIRKQRISGITAQVLERTFMADTGRVRIDLETEDLEGRDEELYSFLVAAGFTTPTP
jgi:hypothetical protein